MIRMVMRMEEYLKTLGLVDLQQIRKGLVEYDKNKKSIAQLQKEIKELERENKAMENHRSNNNNAYLTSHIKERQGSIGQKTVLMETSIAENKYLSEKWDNRLDDFGSEECMKFIEFIDRTVMSQKLVENTTKESKTDYFLRCCQFIEQMVSKNHFLCHAWHCSKPYINPGALNDEKYVDQVIRLAHSYNYMNVCNCPWNRSKSSGSDDTFCTLPIYGTFYTAYENKHSYNDIKYDGNRNVFLFKAFPNIYEIPNIMDRETFTIDNQKCLCRHIDAPCSIL